MLMRLVVPVWSIAALAFLVAAASPVAAADAANSQRVVQKFATSVINAHDVAAVDELFTQDYRQHTPDGKQLPAAAFKQFAAAMFQAFPDVTVTFSPMLSEGDKIAVIGTASGTQTGSFFGMPPSGKRISWKEMHIFRIRGEKIAEHWVQADMFGIVQQIKATSK